MTFLYFVIYLFFSHWPSASPQLPIVPDVNRSAVTCQEETYSVLQPLKSIAAFEYT